MVYFIMLGAEKVSDSTNIQGRSSWLFFTLIVILGLAGGCGKIFVQVPVRAPSVFVADTIPLRALLIIPEDIRQHECKCFRAAGVLYPIYSIQCGSAFQEAYVKTMSRIFIDVQTVKDIKDFNETWDLALWMAVDKFEMSCPIFTNPSACISIRYKLTDKNNKELFSSSISFEEEEEDIEYGFKNVKPFLLASTPSDYLLDVAEPVKIQTAMAEQKLVSRIISQVINKVMIKMAEEIMDAYKKGYI